MYSYKLVLGNDIIYPNNAYSNAESDPNIIIHEMLSIIINNFDNIHKHTTTLDIFKFINSCPYIMITQIHNGKIYPIVMGSIKLFVDNDSLGVKSDYTDTHLNLKEYNINLLISLCNRLNTSHLFSLDKQNVLHSMLIQSIYTQIVISNKCSISHYSSYHNYNMPILSSNVESTSNIEPTLNEKSTTYVKRPTPSKETHVDCNSIIFPKKSFSNDNDLTFIRKTNDKNNTCNRDNSPIPDYDQVIKQTLELLKTKDIKVNNELQSNNNELQSNNNEFNKVNESNVENWYTEDTSEGEYSICSKCLEEEEEGIEDEILNNSNIIETLSNSDYRKSEINNNNMFETNSKCVVLNTLINQMEELAKKYEKKIDKHEDNIHETDELLSQIECNKRYELKLEKMRKDELERKMSEFVGARKSYFLMKQDIIDGKLEEQNISPLFMDRYHIYKFMDDQNDLNNSNAFDIYYYVYNSIHDNDITQIDKTEIPEKYEKYIEENKNKIPSLEKLIEEYKAMGKDKITDATSALINQNIDDQDTENTEFQDMKDSIDADSYDLEEDIDTSIKRNIKLKGI